MPLSFFACSTAKKAENSAHYELRQGVTADTLASRAVSDRHTSRADSISTADSMTVRVHNDTVYIERWHRYTRFKTVERCAADTVYVEHVARRDTTVAVADARQKTIRSSPPGWRHAIFILVLLVWLFYLYKKRA